MTACHPADSVGEKCGSYRRNTGYRPGSCAPLPCQPLSGEHHDPLFCVRYQISIQKMTNLCKHVFTEAVITGHVCNWTCWEGFKLTHTFPFCKWFGFTICIAKIYNSGLVPLFIHTHDVSTYHKEVVVKGIKTVIAFSFRLGYTFLFKRSCVLSVG